MDHLVSKLTYVHLALWIAVVVSGKFSISKFYVDKKCGFWSVPAVVCEFGAMCEYNGWRQAKCMQIISSPFPIHHRR